MIGEVIHEQYRVVELIGEGGMGEVYKALDTELDRPVALKFLKAEFGDDRILIQRFRDELKTLAGFNHPNIATLYTTFTWQARPVMVMELVDGETLEKMVRRRGPIPAQISVPLVKQALAGVGEAHRKKIIHRDLKPANLMLNRDGVVKVMDFGIAKMQNTPGLTRSNTAIGTCLYMAPEQIRGNVDARSDIYSMGVTLYEMLAGRVPFLGDSEYDIQTAHIQQAPQLPTVFYPHIPRAVVDAVLRALAKNPGERFQSAEEFADALGDGKTQTVPVPGSYAPGSYVPGSGLPGFDSIGSIPAITPPPSIRPENPTPTPIPTPIPVPTPLPLSQTPVAASASQSRVPAIEEAVANHLPGQSVLIQREENAQSWLERTGRPRLIAAALLLALAGAGFGTYSWLSTNPKPKPKPDLSSSVPPSQGTTLHELPARSPATGAGEPPSLPMQPPSTGAAPTYPAIGLPPDGNGQTAVNTNPPPREVEKPQTVMAIPAIQGDGLAGRWTGSYESCEDDTSTKATLNLNEPTPGEVTGTLSLADASGAMEVCSLHGVFSAPQKSLLFSVSTCGSARIPNYLLSHRSQLSLSGDELNGSIVPQTPCMTAIFKKM